MAPNKRFRTYGRGASASSSYVNALDILFAENLTKKKLSAKSRKKSKFEIKDLPSKIQTVLNESSLHVNINKDDTFDRVKEPCRNVSTDVRFRVNLSNVSKTSFSLVKNLRNFSTVSPMLKDKSVSKNLLESWLNQPTQEGIINSLEVEHVLPRKAKASDSSRQSPIWLRSCTKSSLNVPSHTEAKEKSKLDPESTNNIIFSNTMKEHMQIHSSTPIVPRRKERLVKQPVSPIKTGDEVKDAIAESLNEIQSWNSSFPTCTIPKHTKRQRKTYDLEEFELTFQSLKNSALKMGGDKSKSKSFTEHEFECFFKKMSSQIGADGTISRVISLKEFESFCELHQKEVSSFFDLRQSFHNFITHRKHKLLKANISYQSPIKEIKLKELFVVINNNELTTNMKTRRSSAMRNSINKKQLTVRLTRLSLSKLKRPYSLPEAKDSRFKACRKFSSNWSSSDISYFNNSRAYCSNNKLSLALGNTQAYLKNTSDTENPAFTEAYSKWLEDNENRNPTDSISPGRLSALYSPDRRYLKTSQLENLFEQSSKNTDSSLIASKLNEKQYIAKILESEARHSNRISMTPNKTEHTSLGRNLFNVSKDNHQEVSHVSQSNAKSSYFSQDLSKFIVHEARSSADNCNNTKDSCDTIYTELDSFSSLDSDKGLFKVPMITERRKEPCLKAGKSWRRSLIQYKRDTVAIRPSFVSNISPTKSAEKSRLSLRIEPASNTPRLRRRTLLQSYVYSELDENNVTNIANDTKIARPILPVVITARDMVLKYCEQSEPKPFEDVFSKEVLNNCKKIGEGVYGEVFMHDDIVLKIIPIEGSELVNGEKQKRFQEILSEIVVTSELSKLRTNTVNRTCGFCQVERISCVKGQYPKELLDAWHKYDELKVSENDCPDLFGDDQLYIILHLINAGKDMEAFIFNNASQAFSVFKQVAYALAVGEEHLQFEHRDLHWGNVLIRSVRTNKRVIFKHKGKLKQCSTQGVEATIIDFTLSRIAHDGVVVYNDLSSDEELFTAKGDYQFDIYRLMRDRNSNDWRNFTPYSNILWMHYVLKKSITALRYKNTTIKTHEKFIAKLREYEAIILNFNSASEFVIECL